ncbi:hypothetical protein ACFC09_26620 [Streptomyces sp. NPDC056161]
MSGIDITAQNSSGDLSERLTRPRYPRSNRYDVRARPPPRLYP